jgi:indole-3-glycerol phosphate synthase
MNILEAIVNTKKAEVAEQKALYPTKLLERSLYFGTPVVSLKKYVTRPDKSGVIAEIKRRSPSKGLINGYVSVEKVSIGYMQAGASALSVLTDMPYFGGSNEDLQIARKFNYCPILRKEFIIDEYQILQARALGADAILLIAAILSPADIARFTSLAHSLDMEVLLEAHSKAEIDALETEPDIIGINNRNLASFQTSVEHSLALVSSLPAGTVKISESGISHPEIAVELREAGFDGFLIGEQFMQHSRPEEACATFIKQFQSLLHEA